MNFAINFDAFRRKMMFGFFVFVVLGSMSSPVLGMNQTGLYDMWEIQVTNSKNYSNPFDFNVIELQATFTSPSGTKINFFGFYDGNGNGGQTGNVWKLRFMPDKVGIWNYTYKWTDGTPGGSGSFNVTDTGLPGPLKVATDNAWYFETARGKPIDFRAYALVQVDRYSPNNSIVADIGWVKNLIQTKVINRGYNFMMVEGLEDRTNAEPGVTWQESWWLNRTDKKRFDLRAWHAWEEGLQLAKNNRIYVLPFDGMIHQGGVYAFTDFKVFLRYFVARFGAYYNFFGWSPIWEWMDVWSASQVNQIMNQVQTWDPFSRLLSVHDCSDGSFTGWLDFSMRQQQSRSVFDGNGRQIGDTQGGCSAKGDVGDAFRNKPIIGSEDIWEDPRGTWGQPRNKTEVRRGAWGIQMAGVMPLYSEWNPEIGGTGTAEPDIRRMFDFFYSKTQYRQYKQLNNLVSSSARQIASGKEGLEYLVYDENGGSITINLSSATGTTFDVLWFNPASGATQNGGQVTGGAWQTLNSPFSGDTVLLLTKGNNQPPSSPDNVSIQ